MKSLNLYAKIEDLLDFYDEYDLLHESYIQKILKSNKKTVLDVGCGSGGMLKKLQKLQIPYLGIDLSAKMVQRCKQQTLNVKHISLDKLDEKFDVITAVGDVLNYLNEDSLRSFLKDVEKTLNDDGIFICDINTIYAFSEVTSGTYIKDDGDRFVSLESDFEDEVLSTEITLFEKQKNCFNKEQGNIIQYFYATQKICSFTSLVLEDVDEISLFTNGVEKLILSFRKC